MGIFLVLAGAVLGLISIVIFAGANALPQQLFAGEVAICGAILFAGGSIIDAVDKLRAQAAKPKTPQTDA